MEFKDFRFKPTERAVFRQLNQSPLILYPIREMLTLTWHKIFMIVQIFLGGVDLPTDKDTNIIRQDLLREKRAVFDRLKRLVRCVVDCKAYDCDGHSTQAALELSRSIAAQAWENKPAQLSQIPGFGPVSVRKWISHGVSTVLGVADKSMLDIERIASRNPPYGRDVQKILENFPKLTLRADIIESRAPTSESDNPVSVTIKVRLGHRNTKALCRWKDRIPSLTLMALTSDGNLAYFWRGSMKKLEKSNELDIKFPVALTAPNQTITCYFSCEEIVGTQVVKSLEPNIPASVFRNVRRQASEPVVPNPESTDIEEDYEDISDEAMMEALEGPRSPRPKHHIEDVESPESNGEFPLIDELLSQEDAPAGSNPMKMDNGRYLCNHHCANGKPTKLGKHCNHKCCREGIDKYRPPKLSKWPGDPENRHDKRDFSQSRPEKEQPFKKATGGGENDSSTPHAALGTGLKRSNAHADKKPRDNLEKQAHEAKRAHPLKRDNTTRPTKLARLNPPSESPSNIEHVDLSNINDDGVMSPPMSPRRRTATQHHRRRLLHLHEEVTGNGMISPRLTKSYTESGNKAGGNSINGLSHETKRAVAASNTHPVCASAHDDPFSDSYDDMSDLPDLDELFGLKEDGKQPNQSEAMAPHMAWTSDETLYPGVARTLKESMDYG